jgi:antitoxin VapB
MSTAHTKVFISNRSQAVRLPKAVALPPSVKEVDIIAIGNRRLITPAGEAWDSWFDEAVVTDDFMGEREQPEDQRRERL